MAVTFISALDEVGHQNNVDNFLPAELEGTVDVYRYTLTVPSPIAASVQQSDVKESRTTKRLVANGIRKSIWGNVLGSPVKISTQGV